MNYNELRKIMAVNQISVQSFADEVQITPEGFRRGMDRQSLAIRYVVPICKALCITPNQLFDFADNKTTTQTQNGGVGNTQIVDTGITALQEQLKEKDRQIARLLDIVAKQS